MGYGVMGYRVDLAAIGVSIGVTDKPARMALRRRVISSGAGGRHADGKGFSTAVSNLLIGPPYAAARHSREATDLNYALEALCNVFGTPLFNNPVSPFRGDFLTLVDGHLKALGFDLVSPLVYGGAPVEIPPPEELPNVGHLDRERVAAFAKAFEGKDLAAKTPALPAETHLARQVVEASEMFRDWVREAQQCKQGLAAFMY